MGDFYSKAPVVTIGIHYIYYGQPKVKTLNYFSKHLHFVHQYIYSWHHASIRMDVANHTVDAYSYAPVLSYGGGEANFIHEVLFTPLNLESPCVAFVCHQQNKTLLKDHNVLTSVCHALLLFLPLLFLGIHWCALRNLSYVDYFV